VEASESDDFRPTSGRKLLKLSPLTFGLTWGAIILTVLRMLQGIGTGGE
jgi:hypothetical protein